MSEIFPLILSGGSGTRLWPLSRSLYPKQYINLGGDSLFGECLERIRAVEDVAAPIVICNQEHRFLAAEVMQRKGYAPGTIGRAPRIILEPVGRNTAPAIALGALAALEEVEDPMLLVLPSDHRIYPQKSFAACVRRAVGVAERNRLVTFGVVPDKPAAGYGYIVHGEERYGAYDIKRFVEKPDQNTALELLSQGKCFWNSGMFVFKADLYLNEMKRLAADIHARVLAAWQKRENDLDFIRADADIFASSPNISIDYAIMEHTDKASVLPLDASWHDLGSWEALYEAGIPDEDENCVFGDVELLDTRNSYIYASSRLVAGIGLSDAVVVESPDAVLVMPKGRGQDVRKILESLKIKKRVEADTHLVVHRPWGSYETLVKGERFQVKRIRVKKGSSLSLQLHHHRAEHWVLVRGTAKVILEEKELLLTENESVYIPLGSRHRLENPGHMELELIEIQTGSYLGEDDIVRFEDDYNR
jgi:mannose-1-phosphate guanylyltransferase/mannose-6-phosphate isomerase